jgi:beta-lactamase class A
MAAIPAKSQDSLPDFARRANDIMAIMSLKGGEERVFAPSFLAEIPATKIRELAQQLIKQNGAVRGIASITPNDGYDGRFTLTYERASAIYSMVLGKTAPHQVIGLQVQSVRQTDDSVAKLERDIHALPGKAGLVVTPLGRGPILAVNRDAPLAIGSVFKLWLLAEAARQVNGGKRDWSDVIPLGPPSLPSGIVQDWPPGSPMTLHTLATLAISISDNSASDTLLHVLGRSNVDAMVSRAGHSDPGITLPLLTTVEAFALKMDEAADLRQVWERGDVKERARLLSRSQSRLQLKAIDRSQFAGNPRSIDTVEWFASPADMAKILDWLRFNGGKEALGIMGVTSPLLKGEAARFRSVGFKGGSEIGVIAMALLLETDRGDWYAVTGAWNNLTAPVDEARFDALMKRAVALIPD